MTVIGLDNRIGTNQILMTAMIITSLCPDNILTTTEIAEDIQNNRNEIISVNDISRTLDFLVRENIVTREFVNMEYRYFIPERE